MAVTGSPAGAVWISAPFISLSAEVRKEMYTLADVSLKHSGWEEYSLLTHLS